jgi:diamine N-acetyltransferase
MTQSQPPTPGPNAAVTLQDVTRDTVRTICNLRVAPAQERFVAPNAISIAEAYFEPTARFHAIYADETPVGFVMFDDDPENAAYHLVRFMIDARYQGYGFGRRALELLIEHIKTRPGATGLSTSCVPGEGSPCPFYEKLGFVSTGDEHYGERVMRLDF